MPDVSSLVSVDEAEETPDEDEVDEARFIWPFVDKVFSLPIKMK